MNCRHCHSQLVHTVIDLGVSPPSNSYLTKADLSRPESSYPLRVLVCDSCWLVQTQDFANAEQLFDKDYAYFSGYSSSWVQHAAAFVEKACREMALGTASMVLEVASNDGYLLQHVQARGIPCLGIEPTASTASAARAKGIPVLEDFFGRDLAERLRSQGCLADLAVANNVLAHVPDINDFLSGFCRIIKADGVASFEFPHLLRLLQQNQFDTIYHEHFSYLSMLAVEKAMRSNGLRPFAVEQLSTHGGSLRVYAQRSDTGGRKSNGTVENLIELECKARLDSIQGYEDFQNRAIGVRDDFKKFLAEARAGGFAVAGYGAAAKGNTLLNYAGIAGDLIRYVVDKNPAKQGKFLPGSRIPIFAPDRLIEEPPDYIVVFPWNIYEEIRAELSHCVSRGAKLVRAVPHLTLS